MLKSSLKQHQRDLNLSVFESDNLSPTSQSDFNNRLDFPRSSFMFGDKYKDEMYQAVHEFSDTTINQSSLTP
jgi:hypothetical protein